MKNWNGLMTVLEFKHLSNDGTVLHREENIRNLIHNAGEGYILGLLFSILQKPQNYYVGLDNRSTLASSSTISSLVGNEPSINGYERQSVDSTSFQIQEVNGVMQARTPILSFRATGGSWGPVRNIFLSTGLGTSSDVILISSASLSFPGGITVGSGEIVTMRMAMSLSNCQ